MSSIALVPKAREWGELYREGGKLLKWYPVHEAQAEILASTARFSAAIAGTGGGKTACGALWLMQRIQEKPMGKFLVVTPSFKVLYSATLPTWKATVAGTDLEGEFRPAYSDIVLPTGGVVYFRSAENPSSMQGIVAHAAWIDEGGLITREAWDTVLQRVGYQRGRVLVTTTPYSHNFLYKDFYTRWRSGDKDYFVRQFPSILNPTYPREEYERARKTLPAHKFAMLYDGVFQRAAGLVYPELDECIADVDAVPPGKLCGGLDWGFNDPFVALAGVLDDDGCLWLFYERYVRGLTVAEHAQHIPKQVQWYGDSANPDGIKTLRRSGFAIKPAKKGAGSIEHGINLVHQRMRRGELKIVRLKGQITCPNLVEEAEEYRYPSRDEESYGDTPAEGQRDHALDALRYLVTMLDRRRALAAA
jgi:phage terminase large subunit